MSKTPLQVRNHPALEKRSFSRNKTKEGEGIVCPGVLGALFIIMERYSRILDKRRREIVLLRGKGCVYRKCPFCDYHLDSCPDEAANYALNREVLNRVTGEFGDLEVINSGSVFELDGGTLNLIREICRERKISTIHFESHYLYRDKIPALREAFSGFTLKLKLGLETFDWNFREKVLRKGIPDQDGAVISRNFDEANFLFGIKGQSPASMERDIELGLTWFERICINIMCPNSTDILPDRELISFFQKELYPKYRKNDRIDILIQNTDFGVGD